MENPSIEEFAKALIQQVRDAAIRSCDLRLSTESASAVANRWRDAVKNVSGVDAVVMSVPDIVDEVVFQFLRAIDQEQLELLYKASTGTVVDLSQDGLGELSGWFMGSGGWRSAYATERFVDDFDDLI